MEAGLNNYIKSIASELLIKRGSTERTNIDNSVDKLIKSLLNYFGSYTRDTILPRRFDQNSDIDIMIKFSNEYDLLNPESYRNQLKKFAQLHYPYTSVLKDHPSIVIELDHIKFDLVPAIFDEHDYDSIEIPGKDGGWLEADPEKYNSIVKPIVRLMKYWNASFGYPFYSFEIEEQIVDMDFSNDNYESGFLFAVENISADLLPN